MGNFTVNGDVANREQAYRELTDLVAGRRYNLGELVLKDGRLEIINNHAVTFLGIHRNDTRTDRKDNQLVRRAVYNLLKTQYPGVEADAAKKELFEEISERLIGKGYSYLPLTRREACGYLQMLKGEYDQGRNAGIDSVDKLFRNEHGIDGKSRKIGGLSREKIEDYSRSENIQPEDWRKVAAEAVFSAAIKAAQKSKDGNLIEELQERVKQAKKLDPDGLAKRVDMLMKKRKTLNGKFAQLQGDWKLEDVKKRLAQKKEIAVLQKNENVNRLKGNQDTYRHDVQLHKDVKTVLESLKEMLATNYPKGATVLLGANPTQVKLGGKTYNLVRPRPLKEGEKEQKLAKNEILLDPDDERASFTVNADGQARTVIRACKIDITEEQVRKWLGNREGLDAVEVLGEVNGQLRRGGLEIEEIIRDCEEQAANCQNELQRTTEALKKAEAGGDDNAEAGGDDEQKALSAIEEVKTKRAAVQKTLEGISERILGASRKFVGASQQGNAPRNPVGDNGDYCSLQIDEAKAQLEELEAELNAIAGEADKIAKDVEAFKKLPKWERRLSELQQDLTPELLEVLKEQTFALLVEREKILKPVPYCDYKERMLPVAAEIFKGTWTREVNDFVSFKGAILDKLFEHEEGTHRRTSLAKEVTLEGVNGDVTLSKDKVGHIIMDVFIKKAEEQLNSARDEVVRNLKEWFAEGHEAASLERFLERMAVMVGTRIQLAMNIGEPDKGSELAYFLRDVRKAIADEMVKLGASDNEANRNRLEQLFHADADAVDPEVKTGAGGPPGGDFFNMIKSGGKYKEQELAAYISSFNARGLKSNGSDVRIDEAMVRGLDESFIRNAQKELAQIRMTAEMIGIDWEWLEPHMDFGIGVFVSYATMLQTALGDVAGKIDETLTKGIPADEAELADYRKALLDAHKLLSARKAMFGRMKRVRGLIDQANSVNPAEDGQEQTELEKAVEGFSRANVNSPMQGEGAGFFAKLFATKAEKEEQKNTEFYNKGFVDSVGRQLAGNMANRLVRFAKVQFEALNTGINGLYADVNPENKVELADEVNPEDGVVQKNQAVTEDSRWKALNAAINRFNASLGEKGRGKLQIKTEDLQTPETWRRAGKWQRYQQDIPSFVQQQFYMGMDGDVVDFPGLEEELAEFDNSRKVNSKDVDSYKLKPLYYVIDPEFQGKEEPNGI